MNTAIYLVLTFDITSRDFDALSALVDLITNNSKKEDGYLTYEFAVNEDRNTAYMIEQFESSETFVRHIVDGFSPHAEEWNKHLNLRTIVVIGDASEALRALLPDDAIYTTRIPG